MSAVWTINLKANVVLLVMLAIIMVVYFQIWAVNFNVRKVALRANHAINSKVGILFAWRSQIRRSLQTDEFGVRDCWFMWTVRRITNTRAFFGNNLRVAGSLDILRTGRLRSRIVIILRLQVETSCIGLSLVWPWRVNQNLARYSPFCSVVERWAWDMYGTQALVIFRSTFTRRTRAFLQLTWVKMT